MNKVLEYNLNYHYNYCNFCNDIYKVQLRSLFDYYSYLFDLNYYYLGYLIENFGID